MRVVARGPVKSKGPEAINRQLGHYACHIGQIVLLAKHYKGSEWKTLSIPKNKSAEVNARVSAGESSRR